MKHVALLAVNGKYVEIHYFNRPGPTEPGFYRATMSYNALCDREAERYDKWYHSKPRRPPLARSMSVGRVDDKTHTLEFYKDLPTFDHPTIWAMYNAVSYDYKKRKFK